MSQEYSRALLRVCVAQICQHLGWNSIMSTPLELLTDVLERYLLMVSRNTHRYSEQFGRTDPRLEDVILALGQMGVQMSELDDYMRHVEPQPFAKEVVAFPIPQENDLKFPNPDSKEVQQRKVFEFVPEYLPYMHPELNEDSEESLPAAPTSPERLQVETQSMELSPGQADKRGMPSPGEFGPPFKRPRMTTSQNLPEEAFHSQYEMTSVVMTNSGILSPLREGKLPDTNNPPATARHKSSTVAVSVTPGANLNPGTQIIMCDLVDDPSGKKKIVEVEKDSGAQVNLDRRDPEFVPSKKKVKTKIPKDPKIKRGPGRPKLMKPKVIHNKGAVDISVLSLPRKDDSLSGSKYSATGTSSEQTAPMDLSLKPTPLPHHINVKVEDGASDHVKHVEHRSKNTPLSKEMEKDIDDTIASVIEKSKVVDLQRPEYSVVKPNFAIQKEVSPIEKLLREDKKKDEKKKEEKKAAPAGSDIWRVSSVEFGRSPESDHGEEGAMERFSPPGGEFSTGTHIAPHLALLHQMSKPRGRPRGSTSAYPRGMRGMGRSPLGRKPGRPPLSRSPGRPPLTRSPGRPAGRSPGRPPGSGRSPGRPKSKTQNQSPRPRGRPRGSKSPRNRGASPRGASPRAILAINFDDNTAAPPPVVSALDDDEDATRFDFNTASPDRDTAETLSKRVELKQEQFSPIPSPVFSDKERTPEPPRTPQLPIKKEMTPDISSLDRESSDSKRDTSVESELTSRGDRSRAPSILSGEDDTRVYSKDSDWDDRERSLEKERSRMEVHSRKDRSLEGEHKERSRDRESKERSRDREFKERSRDRDFKESVRDKDNSRERERSERDRREYSNDREHKERSRDREMKEHSKDRERSKEKFRDKEHKKDKKKKKKKDKDKDKDRDKEKDKERKEKHKVKETEGREESPSVQQPLAKLKIKFGGGSTSKGSFSISSAPTPESPTKRESMSPPVHRPEIPKLKFKVLPPKPASTPEHDKSSEASAPLSWVSTIKTEPIRSSSPQEEEPMFSSSSSNSPEYTASSSKIKHLHEELDEPPIKEVKSEQLVDKDGEEEVTVSVVKGKIITKKTPKNRKRRGSAKKTVRPAQKQKSLLESSANVFSSSEDKAAGKEGSPSPSAILTEQNVPSPITIPALKAAPPPPPSPPPSNKKSALKAKLTIKDPRASSPLVKDSPKPRPPPVHIPKGNKPIKSPRRQSPRKSPKISPPTKKKGLFPSVSPLKTVSPGKPSATESVAPKTPPPSRGSSPSRSGPSSPMYSPASQASSPSRDSSFILPPPTPAFPGRSISPPHSPLFRQMSTDDEKEATPPVEKPKMPPPSLPPMPPTLAMRKAQRTVVAETVGTFVDEGEVEKETKKPQLRKKKSSDNEAGEKVWICPSCTLQDDGSPMIGCDICDDWYHWECVNIREEPEQDSWYCPKCVKPTKGSKKRGRRKKRGGGP